MKKIKKQILKALEYLEQNPDQSLTQIGKKFQTDRHTLSRYLQKDFINKNNLYENSQGIDDYLYYFSDEELAYLYYYQNHSKEPYNKLKEKFPNAPKIETMRNQMNILGLPYYKGYLRKYWYNEDRFNMIETEEDAYWLGFITADGCILKTRNVLDICLGAIDKEHLIKFCEYMGISADEAEKAIKDDFGGAYTRDNPVNRICINSKQIVQNLKDKGIAPRKSGKEQPYICSTVELERAYIRGLIDGDGTVGKAYPAFAMSGSYDICNYVKNFITLHIKNIDKIPIRPKGVIWTLELRGKVQTSLILNYFYSDSKIFLDRKKQLVDSKYKINT